MDGPDSLDPIELDQEDIFALLQADPYLATVPVLLQRKGVTESDIETALSTLNSAGGAVGAVLIVIMPALKPESPDAPGPLYNVTLSVQVVTSPLFALAEGGSGFSSEQLATRVRQLLHLRNLGRGGVLCFASVEPLPGDEGKVSYGVTFTRRGNDAPLVKCARPQITFGGGNVTIACATLGATIIFTVSGQYPSPAADAADDALIYAAPVALAPLVTVRAVAYADGFAQSDCAQLTVPSS